MSISKAEKWGRLGRRLYIEPGDYKKKEDVPRETLPGGRTEKKC